MNNTFTKVDAMIAHVKKGLAKIDSKPISQEQKTIEATEFMENEWHMIVQEVRHKESNKASLITHPSYKNSKHLLIFLDEACSHMEAFLKKQIQNNGKIKFGCELDLHFTNIITNMENNQTITIGPFEYDDMVELSRSFNQEICDLFIHLINKHSGAKKGYDIHEVRCFKINML